MSWRNRPNGMVAKRRPTVKFTPVLVGRETELSVITSGLGAARACRESSVCFAGLPGIGKTSLLDAAVADLSDPGRRRGVDRRTRR